MSKSKWQSDDHAPQMHTLECTAHNPRESNAEEVPTTKWATVSSGSLCANDAPSPQLKVTISFDRPESGSKKWPMRLNVTRDNSPYIDLEAALEEKDLKALGRKIMEL